MRALSRFFKRLTSWTKTRGDGTSIRQRAQACGRRGNHGPKAAQIGAKGRRRAVEFYLCALDDRAGNVHTHHSTCG
jgi:hypothetical protein